MAGVNKVILVGNLGGDPEVRHLENGSVVASMTLATNETFTNRSTGEKTEHAEWHRVVMWRGLAEVAEKYLKKGSQIYVEGKLRTRSWDDDGITRYVTEIVADQMTMLGSSQGGNRPPSPTQEEPVSGMQSGHTEFAGEATDDLPF